MKKGIYLDDVKTPSYRYDCFSVPELIGALLLIMTTDIPFSMLIQSGAISDEELRVLKHMRQRSLLM
ncbi:hypothetical protein [Guptibacillus algicola]|uniref:hypothetical protein n=1 Tax=Guptibacillus algicola TaxID=225844 RepID=UPI001CD7146B|nr:hypothetical protein [Alkalihalobacillus algicola]MCA0988285.1 hypothetical protein [Alkalihalobacillus algicola]